MSANLVSALRDTAEIALLPGFVRDESTQAADEIDRLRMENEALKGQLHKEIAANLAFREKGGALADEDMPTFCDRLLVRIAELEAGKDEAARRDAERWREIERRFENASTIHCERALQYLGLPSRQKNLLNFGATVDAEIDAAKENSK